MGSNDIRLEQVTKLLQDPAVMPGLHSLMLHGLRTNSDEFNIFCHRVLQPRFENETLQVLGLNGTNGIGDAEVDVLTSLDPTHCGLVDVGFSFPDCSIGGARKLVKWVSKIPSLRFAFMYLGGYKCFGYHDRDIPSYWSHEAAAWRSMCPDKMIITDPRVSQFIKIRKTT